MAFKEFAKELKGNRIEGELLKAIFYSLLTSFIFLAITYFFKFKYMDNFIYKYGYYLFFSALSIALIMPAVRQLNAYKEMACMSGMMVGMTIGMISGFLLGFFTSSTNGIFYGGFFGVLVGIFMGVWLGKCCGIMGIMEGMMAGLMGGTMGPMITLMMLSDNLVWFMPFYIIVNMIILLGLSYMLYEEVVENRTDIKKQPVSFSVFALLSTFAVLVLIYIMLYAPKSAAIGFQ